MSTPQDPLHAYVEWFSELKPSWARDFLAHRVRACFPVWPPLTPDEVRSVGQGLHADVVDRLWRFALRPNSFHAEGAVLTLMGITDLRVAEEAAVDEAEWVRGMQERIDTGIPFLMDMAKDAVIRRPEVRRGIGELARSWRDLRSTTLSMDGLLAWNAHKVAEEASKYDDHPDVVAAREELRRRRAGEYDEA